ncbi:MAG: cysteine desulfurase CsdA [Waddliaceae bacterium]|nr:cysteine desulfurase CsdA [Waddliaceae bacterium]
MSLDNCRSDFPMLQKMMHGHPICYLDSAATAQKPSVVIDSIKRFYQEEYGTVHRAVYEIALASTEAYDRARTKLRAFLNAKHDREIIFTSGCTEAINLVASSFSRAFISEGDEVIISQIDHHSNIVPWQIVCEERKAVLKVIPALDDGSLDLDAFERLLSDRCKIVAVGHASNSIGTINPVREIIKMAHSKGAKVLVDGAQSAPHMPINVQELDCDFYTLAGHKLMGPTGVGVLYGKEELLEQMPPYQSGGDMIDRVSLEKTTYADLPLKFEAGTPMFAQVIALGVAIDYLTAKGMDRIFQHELELLEYAKPKLMEIDGLRIIGEAKNKLAILSFVVEGAHHLDIGTFLDLKGIAVRTGHHCAQPCMDRFSVTGTVRASLALYNDKEDIDRLVNGLEDVLKKLRV